MRFETGNGKDFLRVREICGPALALLHEAWRTEALIAFESATSDEERIRCQTLSVMHRDLAAKWRDDEATARETVLDADRAQNPEAAI